MVLVKTPSEMKRSVTEQVTNWFESLRTTLIIDRDKEGKEK